MGHKSRNCTHLIFRRSRGHSTSLPHLLHLRDSRTMNYSRGMAAAARVVVAARVRAAAARARAARVTVAAARVTESTSVFCLKYLD